MFKHLVTVLTLALIPGITHADTLTHVDDFGDNPGEIDMYIYVPDNMPATAPLVVALHGCRQDAHTYQNAGWRALADEWKFYLLLPEQKNSNNPYNCWNWFSADDTKRGQGEAASIMQMIETMKARFPVDANRIYIEGLSAGGYMTAVMLANYPDVFAGGAINAGGPAFCAQVKQRFWDPFGWWYLYAANLSARRCMNGHDRAPDDWAELVADEGHADHNGPWPVLSLWQGEADETVHKSNQQELLEQWTEIHGIDREPEHEARIGPANILHREYHDAAGNVLIETWLVPGMAHGTPINTGDSAACGTASKYILDAGICAVRRIGKFWGLDKQ